MTPKADLLLLIGGRVCVALIALATLRAVTTFLIPGEYGELSLLIALQVFCGLVFINPVGQLINLHTHAWWDDGTLLARLKKYRSYVFGVSCIGALVTFAVGIGNPASQLLTNCFAVFFMVLFATWNATLVSILNMLGFRGVAVLWGVATAAVGAAVSIALVIWTPTGTAWFVGQLFGMTVGTIGAYHALSGRATVSAPSARTPALFVRSDIFKYLMPLALATGLMWLQLSGYRFLVEWQWGLSQLGFVALGLQLANQIWGLVESLAMQFLYPMFYRRIADDKSEEGTILAISDLLNILAPVYLVLAGLIISGAPSLLKLLVAPQYFDSVKFLYIGAFIELGRSLANVVSNAAQAKNATKTLLLPYALGAALTLGMIQIAGNAQLAIQWVGAALIAGILGMSLAMFICMRRLVRFRLDGIRCCAAAVVMLCLIMTTRWIPALAGILPNIAVLLGLLFFAATTLVIVLRGNPAVVRLLTVQLKGI